MKASKPNRFLTQLSIATLLTTVTIFSFQQKSHAFKLKPVLDELAKRSLCSLFGITTGECAPKDQNAFPPTSAPTVPAAPIPDPTTPTPLETPPTIPPEIEQSSPSPILFQVQ